jgi:hypothetical protein
VDQLARYIDVDIALSELVLTYFDTPSLYQITTSNIFDLINKKWLSRVWEAGRWIKRLQKVFYAPVAELTQCKPALWASSPNPGLTINGTTGNLNLIRFIQRCYLSKNDADERTAVVLELNNQLRQQARDALLHFLYDGISVSLNSFLPGQFAKEPQDLTDLFLLDVNAGIKEHVTRIDDAIAAAQRLMIRAKIGLEPEFTVNDYLSREWDRKFATYEVWRARQLRTIYSENWAH